MEVGGCWACGCFKYWFLMNTVLLNFLFIKEMKRCGVTVFNTDNIKKCFFEHQISMISEGLIMKLWRTKGRKTGLDYKEGGSVLLWQEEQTSLRIPLNEIRHTGQTGRMTLATYIMSAVVGLMDRAWTGNPR